MMRVRLAQHEPCNRPVPASRPALSDGRHLLCPDRDTPRGTAAKNPFRLVVSWHGPGWKAALDEMIARAVDDALEDAPKKAKRTDSALEQLITRAARGVAVHHWGKKPVMTVLITRLEDE